MCNFLLSLHLRCINKICLGTHTDFTMLNDGENIYNIGFSLANNMGLFVFLAPQYYTCTSFHSRPSVAPHENAYVHMCILCWESVRYANK